MPSLLRSTYRNLLLLLAAASSGCTSWLNRDAEQLQWHVPIPTDATAAIIASALVVELNAEAIAPISGAPVQDQDDRTFRIELTRNRRGDWLPVANHRLILRAQNDVARAESIPQAKDSLPGFGHNTTRSVIINVEPSKTGSKLKLSANAADMKRLIPLIQHTLHLAESIEGSGPGLAESNLSAWRLSHLLRAAKQTSTGNQRANLLRRAARQPTAPSSLFRELAQLAAEDGELTDAKMHLRRGLLAETDIHIRAELAGLSNDLQMQTGEPTDLRARALELLFAEDTAAAEKLLHSARRTDLQPAVDYQLLAHVHRHRGDEMAALAAQLLAREYDQSNQVSDYSSDIAHDRGISELAHRLSLRKNPVPPSSWTPLPAQQTPATPPR